jgi:hypothetical protein
MRRFGFLAAAAMLIGVALPARALAEEPSAAEQPSVAEQLFRDGHALMKDRRYSEACPKFAESQQRDPASGTLLALAYCQELANLLASAQASYTAAAELARSENQEERRSAATARAAALTGRISTITVNVPEPVAALPSLVVKSNGVEVARTAWGWPVPNDGGNHVIEASAPGRQSWSTQVLLGPERDQRVVSLPMLEDLSPPVAAPAQRSAPLSDAPSSEHRYWTTPRAVGWGAVGAGVVAGVAALYFADSAHAAQTDVNTALKSEQSMPVGARPTWDTIGSAREADGQRAQTLSEVFGVSAGALILGGAALAIFAPDNTKQQEPAAPSVSLVLLPGMARLGYAGKF